MKKLLIIICLYAHMGNAMYDQRLDDDRYAFLPMHMAIELQKTQLSVNTKEEAACLITTIYTKFCASNAGSPATPEEIGQGIVKLLKEVKSK